MAVYRAGIVGLTGIASGKAGSAPHDVLGSIQGGSHASGYAQVPATRVVGACDLVPALTEQFVSQWGAVWPEVRPYSDYRQLLSEGALDLLSVVTSDHRHAQIVVDAAEAGVKGIYCEKPIATTLADADRMIAACQASGTVLSDRPHPALAPHLAPGAEPDQLPRDRPPAAHRRHPLRAPGDALPQRHPPPGHGHLLRRISPRGGGRRAGRRAQGLRPASTPATAGATPPPTPEGAPTSTSRTACGPSSTPPRRTSRGGSSSSTARTGASGWTTPVAPPTCGSPGAPKGGRGARCAGSFKRRTPRAPDCGPGSRRSCVTSTPAGRGVTRAPWSPLPKPRGRCWRYCWGFLQSSHGGSARVTFPVHDWRA